MSKQIPTQYCHSSPPLSSPKTKMAIIPVCLSFSSSIIITAYHS